MAIAIGGGSNSLPPHGKFWVDVRNYGAKAVSGFDNAPAFQAAHDALAAMIKAAPQGQDWRGTVFVPSAAQAYNVASPVYIDSPGITFAGEGTGTLIQTGLLGANGVSFVNCPAFLIGYRRPATVGGTYSANSANYRPDLYGVLDTTVASAAGKRWGFRSNGNAFIIDHGTPFSHGGVSPSLGYPYADMWAETQTLTIEFAIQGFANGLLPANAKLFGASDGGNNNCPLAVITDGSGNIAPYWNTQAVRFGTINRYRTAIPQASGGGIQRVTLQIDLVHGVVTAWVNGIQQYTGGGIGGNMVPGAYFSENFLYPHVVAGYGLTDSWGATPIDFALYGMSYSRTLRYAVGTNGSTQVRASDGGAYSGLSYASVPDSYRYFYSTDSGLFAFFTFAEPPSAQNPMLTIGNGPSTGGAGSAPAFIGYNGMLSLGGILNQGLRDMKIASYWNWGSPVLIAQVLNTTFMNVEFSGGCWAVADLPMESNYIILFDKTCSFSSSQDAAMYFYQGTVTLRDAYIQSGGRCQMRLVDSNLTADSIMIAFCNANCQFAIASIHGASDTGQITIRSVLQDIEGGGEVSRGGIYAGGGQAGVTVRLGDISGGDVSGVPFIIADDNGISASGNQLQLIVDNATPWLSSASAFVQSTGPAWTGSIRNCQLGQSPHLSSTGQYGQGSRIKFYDSTYPAPPHGGSWYAGSHILQVPLQADGQYTEWRCSKTGTYGSPTPPQWVGLNVIQVTPQSLAAYVFDHTVLATTAYGGSAWGWWSDTLTGATLQALFGGGTSASIGTTTTLQFGLALASPLKCGTAPSEPSGNGYSRASLANNLTNFPASTGGVKSNGVAISWPTLTGAINGVVGISILDQSNHLLGYLQFASPVNFASGSTPTIGVGGLTLTQTPTNIKGFLTQYGWGKVADCYFGGVALAPPSTWYLGLSTSHSSITGALSEPSGNGYARAAMPNDTNHFTACAGRGSYISSWNSASPAFATPTGAGWGTILSVALLDAATSGNCWFVGDAPSPAAAASGSAPTVAAGALLLSI